MDVNRLFGSVLVGVVCAFASAAQAGIVSFTDRGAFESYIGAFTVDNFSDIPDGFNDVGFTRPDFSYDGSHFGCELGVSQCGDNSSSGFDYPGYLWVYETGTFSFGSGIAAFGLDLGTRNSSSKTLALNGVDTTVTSGTPNFFGIASDDGSTFSNVILSGVSSGDLFDNVTYSSTPNDVGNPVPAPAPIALLALGLLGIRLLRHA